MPVSVSWRRVPLAASLALVLAGCTATRGLKLTEVGAGVIELYLDEPPGNRLALRDHVLQYATTDSMGGALVEGQVELIGSLAGGEFLVVYEEQGHTGPPVQQNYTNFFGQSVLGIVVAPGTLGVVDNARRYAFRVSARRTRYVFPFFYAVDETDDAVAFGARPRPAVGGEFAENGDLDQVMRSATQGATRGRTVRRKTIDVNGVEVPRDRDLEQDWREDDESFGTAD